MKKKSILIVEPYFGGSHKQFLLGLKEAVDADYTLLTLPARKWKMRMQLSAPWFAEQVQAMQCDKRGFDTVLCSTFVDVAVLRSLLSNLKGVNGCMRYCTYFHENQFVYPGQIEDMNNHQFTSINFNTALVSDALAFNSYYNLESFLENCGRYIKKAADMSLGKSLESIREKCRVLYPGLDFTAIDQASKKRMTTVPTIVWNHRWEHDKNPETFFKTLFLLEEKGIPFKLIVLGQSFRNQPPIFKVAETRLRERIIHFGYVDSREEYGSLLQQGDIVVSTAHHEFFGISVIEAVRAGCRPLLPQRLSYPELFDEKYLYADDGFARRLERLLDDFTRLDKTVARGMTDRYQWKALREKYENWLF